MMAYDCEPEEMRALERHAAGRVALRLCPAPLDGANAALARGSRCVSVSHRYAVDAALLEQLWANGVRGLCSRSVGLDHIDRRAAQALGIAVESTPYSPEAVAEYTLMRMLQVLRRANADGYGLQLCDCRVAVLGTGRIGRAVLARLRGFGCRLLACDPQPCPETGADYLPLEALLAQAELLTLHLPLQADTHHLLNKERLALMKPGALLVNTSRGGVVDTGALLDALEAERLGGAALDVWEETEAYTARLSRLPGVLLSRHCAYRTRRALEEIAAHSVACAQHFEGGDPLWKN